MKVGLDNLMYRVYWKQEKLRETVNNLFDILEWMDGRAQATMKGAKEARVT